MMKPVLLYFVLYLAGVTAQAQTYLNPDAGIDERVNDLINRLTLEEKAAQMLMNAPAIPRLNIPAYDYWNEALHGVGRSGKATVFPQAIGMAAPFDEDLLLRVSSAISDEARAKYNAAGVLPLADDLHQYYVVGPNAATIDAMLGNYFGVNPNIVTFLEGIT